MRMLTFAKRNAKEILRDPLSVAFGIGFPVVVLLLLSAIQANIPVPLFEIQNVSPGITVFGLSFITLFSATVISRDRTSSLLQRLYTTPMTSWDFILGYTLPVIPIAVAQCTVCYVVAIILGLDVTVNLFLAIIMIIPVSIFYIALGLFFGSILNDRQVGGVCGALLTNLSAWLSGIWFDLELAGEVFKGIAELLPFSHAVNMSKAIIAGNYNEILPHLLWVLAYTAVTITAAILCFLRQMKRN